MLGYFSTAVQAIVKLPLSSAQYLNELAFRSRSLNVPEREEVLREVNRIINLTPHTIVVDDGKRVVAYDPSGEVARVLTESTVVGEVDGFEVVSTKVVGDNLPEPQDGVYYLVSAMVKGLRPERKDLLSPNTGAAKRNDKGHIVSVPGFIA